MPITYTWTATALIGYPVIDGETDVVTRASYTVLADDGEGHTAEYGNFAYTPLDPSVPFISYADLTPEIIIGWVQYAIGPDAIAAIQGSLAIQIERQINPPPQPEVLPLPWVPVVVVEKPAPIAEPVEEVSSGESFIATPATLRAEQIVDPLILPTSDVPPSVDGMSTNILG
jgi:hypothetical protein